MIPSAEIILPLSRCV